MAVRADKAGGMLPLRAGPQRVAVAAPSLVRTVPERAAPAPSGGEAAAREGPYRRGYRPAPARPVARLAPKAITIRAPAALCEPLEAMTGRVALVGPLAA